MKEILFASNNQHKVDEVKELLPVGYSLLGLRDIQWTEDIPEPFDTYEDNAKAKAYYVFDRTGLSCFADDSGLEIDALDGRPGVYSARYAGASRNAMDNIEKVLEELADSNHRNARFHSVIAYMKGMDEIRIFRGHVEGKITFGPSGSGGFGYDPIFIPDGFDQTFGELPDKVKNMISHRAKAMQRFMEYLRNTKS